MSEPEAERELLREWIAGDDSAFPRLHALYLPMLMASTRAIAPPGDLEDVCQQTFIKLWEWRGRIRPELSVRAWLRRVAKHLAIGRIRRERGRRVLVADFSWASTDAESDDEPPVAQMYAAVRRLPASQRELIEEHYRGGLSYARLAERLGTTPGAIRTRACRARQAVRAAVQTNDWHG